MKIDKRKNYYVVLDTETCPIDKDLQGVDPRNMWVYDIGWAIIDKRGNVYKTRSFLNTDIFLEEAELMKSAYYADKIPKYKREAKETCLLRNIFKGWAILSFFMWKELSHH